MKNEIQRFKTLKQAIGIYTIFFQNIEPNFQTSKLQYPAVEKLSPSTYK